MSLHWCVSGRGTARLQALLYFRSVRNTFAFYSHLCFLWRRRILRSLMRRQPFRTHVTTSFERQFFLRERLAGTLEVGNFLFLFCRGLPLWRYTAEMARITAISFSTPVNVTFSQRNVAAIKSKNISISVFTLDIFIFWKLWCYLIPLAHFVSRVFFCHLDPQNLCIFMIFLIFLTNDFHGTLQKLKS